HLGVGMTSVIRPLSYTCVPDGARGSVCLGYSTAEPLVVVMDFGTSPDRGRITWITSRDLLAEGLVDGVLAGAGDFRCWNDGDFHIALTSYDGSLEILLHPSGVRGFLAATERLVPIGGETLDF